MALRVYRRQTDEAGSALRVGFADFAFTKALRGFWGGKEEEEKDEYG